MKRQYLCKWYISIERFLIIAQNKNTIIIKRQRKMYQWIPPFLLSRKTFELPRSGRELSGSSKWFYCNEFDFNRIKNELKEYNKRVKPGNKIVNRNISIDLINDAIDNLNILTEAYHALGYEPPINLKINNGKIHSNLKKDNDNSVTINRERRFFNT